MGSNKHDWEEDLEAFSPKKAQTAALEVGSSKTLHVDKEGQAAYKVSREQWTMESRALEDMDEGSK
jgi:hypothetical protein